MRLKRFDSLERKKILEKSQECLWSKEGEPGLEYLTQKRNLSIEICKQFQLGFMPSFVPHMLNNRIIFPIIDSSNNLVSLSSRFIGDQSDTSLPVYWHEAYEKSFYLYGVNIAKKHIREKKYVLMVEGQFDVMQMHNHGFKNSVGVLSTNLHKIQLSVIYRYTNNVILLFDTDKNKSGQKGASRAIENMFSMSNFPVEQYRDNVQSIEFQENSDPDEFLKKCGSIPLQNIIDLKLRSMKELV